MKKNIKRMLLAVLSVLVIAAIYIYKNLPMDLDTTTIVPKTAELSFTEQGIVLAQRQVEVYATVPGIITNFSIREGQFINQGGILCKIDGSQKEADLQRAKEIEETTRTLYNADFLPRQDLTEAEKTVHDIERSLMDMTIKSPVSGVISKLNIKDTNVVNLANPIAVIAAERDCVVETYVHIKDMSAIEPGKKVTLVLEGRSADKEIPGTIISIEDHAVIQISVLGVEERKVKVTIAPEEYGELKDGYDLDVRFNYYHEENKVTVPKTAVFTENDIETLWVVKNGKTQKIHVQKGMELRTEFVIESGLNSGDIVIVDSNVKGLKNGVKIRV